MKKRLTESFKAILGEIYLTKFVLQFISLLKSFPPDVQLQCFLHLQLAISCVMARIFSKVNNVINSNNSNNDENNNNNNNNNQSGSLGLSQ